MENITITLRGEDEGTSADGKQNMWMILDNQYIFLPLNPPSLQIDSCSIHPECLLHY